ncbi:MAG: hypothetical protein KIT35_22430 [Piscinibacter sp.]|uniref:hypothetical protein n=1 Tax=Piscinibacter TaxID=1114981 RepID=UPI0013E37803|nr:MULTISPECIES: hypothetical protein [Piscinibacter]MCW5666598.1 hypothetical protein [Piscinibacter sp.]
MNADLRDFLARLAGAIVMTLVPVVLVTFLSMPMSLGRHPGEPLPEAQAAGRHMT